MSLGWDWLLMHSPVPGNMGALLHHSEKRKIGRKSRAAAAKRGNKTGSQGSGANTERGEIGRFSLLCQAEKGKMHTMPRPGNERSGNQSANRIRLLLRRRCAAAVGLVEGRGPILPAPSGDHSIPGCIAQGRCAGWSTVGQPLHQARQASAQA